MIYARATTGETISLGWYQRNTGSGDVWDGGSVLVSSLVITTPGFHRKLNIKGADGVPRKPIAHNFKAQSGPPDGDEKSLGVRSDCRSRLKCK